MNKRKRSNNDFLFTSSGLPSKFNRAASRNVTPPLRRAAVYDNDDNSWQDDCSNSSMEWDNEPMEMEDVTPIVVRSSLLPRHGHTTHSTIHAPTMMQRNLFAEQERAFEAKMNTSAFRIDIKQTKLDENELRRPSLAAVGHVDAYFEVATAFSPRPLTASGSSVAEETSTALSSYTNVSIMYTLRNGEIEKHNQTIVLENRLGAGQFAEVYQGRLIQGSNAFASESVAIKIMKNHSVLGEKSFFREVRAMQATLDHPNTLDIIGYRGAPHFWIITPMMQGGSLANQIQKQPLSEQQIVHISLQITSTMDYLHRKGIMHRDLTPENLLIKDTATMEVCLGDFGLAEIVGTVPSRLAELHLSPNGHPRYRAPEVTQGHYTQASEVYNFGSCLYEMITGTKPLEDIPDNQVGIMIARGLKPMLPSQGMMTADSMSGPTECETLGDLVNWCCSTNPAARPSWDDIYEFLSS